jgi:hypothetical protein
MSVALVIQQAKRMRRIILSSVACLALAYFSTLSHKRHEFRKKFIGTIFWRWLLIQMFIVIHGLWSANLKCMCVCVCVCVCVCAGNTRLVL